MTFFLLTRKLTISSFKLNPSWICTSGLILASVFMFVRASHFFEKKQDQFTFNLNERVVDKMSLFGGSAGWTRIPWETVDDRVRGGRSESQLIIDEQRDYAIFKGNLDTTTLGGAGFASQRTFSQDVHGEPVQFKFLSEYKGISIKVIHPLFSSSQVPQIINPKNQTPKTFALNLQTVESNDRGDGRYASTVSYKYSFTVPSLTQPSSQYTFRPDSPISEKQEFLELYVPWNQFEKTYRGRPAPDAPNLVPSDIKHFSIMYQSYFGKQDGDFELMISEISAFS